MSIWYFVGSILIGLGILLTIQIDGKSGPILLLIGLIISAWKDIYDAIFKTIDSPRKKSMCERISALSFFILTISFLVSLNKDWELIALGLFMIGTGGVLFVIILGAIDRNR